MPEDRQQCDVVWQEGDAAMHIHGNQLDANLQVQALAAAAKADEKEAERVRERLRKAAAALAGESDDADCVVRLSGDDEGQEQAGQQGGGEQKPDEHAADEGDGEVFSDWA
jgi:hypothetical protein